MSESEAERRRREADEEELRKREEKERKKAEVRKRLEEASRSKKTKKGFMTPERKKKLRLLLRKIAAEQLKKEQEKKAQERRRIIKERCGEPKSLDGVNEATLQALCKEFHKRIVSLEDVKYDLEFEVRQKDYQINELNVELNDLKGRFVKPILKKVQKYDTSKLQKLAKAAELDFRTNLKKVETNKFTLEEAEKEKPEWALGAKKSEGGEVVDGVDGGEE